jgi:hypothetical protein
MEQLEANLGAQGWSLSHQQMDQLNQASQPAVSLYPYTPDYAQRYTRE